MQLSSVYLYEKIKRNMKLRKGELYPVQTDICAPFCVMKKKKHFDMGMFMWYRDMTKSGNRQF